ncbi:putative nuclease HARBI1 [Heterodontus francisci]|uniref:putative nuclease HARBI1 n=1 Tax=Heterodontus francisci TaxID=7792 RepID=UPI00355B55F6
MGLIHPGFGDLIEDVVHLRGREGQALKVSVAVNFYDSGSFQGSTGEMCGISQSMTHHCIKITNGMFRRAGDYVCFCIDPNSQAERAIGFWAIAGFSQVQGVIDCMHVAIKAPTDQPAAFIDQKGFHSRNVQLVLRQQQELLSVCTHFPGSCHDSFMLCQSRLPQSFTPMPKVCGWNLGGKGNPLKRRLLTPLRKPQTEVQRQNNQYHLLSRTTIEEAIGFLKMRFRCLDWLGGTLQ